MIAARAIFHPGGVVRTQQQVEGTTVSLLGFIAPLQNHFLHRYIPTKPLIWAFYKVEASAQSWGSCPRPSLAICRQ